MSATKYFEIPKIQMGKDTKEKYEKFPWTTPPADVRFCQTNITRYCYQMFIDYHRCTRLLGEKYAKCDYFKKNYQSLCPNEWITKFENQIETGTFPVCLPPKKKK